MFFLMAETRRTKCCSPISVDEVRLRQAVKSLYDTHYYVPFVSRILEQLWIGDIFTAVDVALGKTHLHVLGCANSGTVGAVLNASELEVFGATLAGNYFQRQIYYDTLMNVGGLALRDGAMSEIDELAEQMAHDNNAECRQRVQIYSRDRAVHPYAVSHMSIFRRTMFKAADRIESMLWNIPHDRVVLVHSMSGCNRAAACIVAYLVLKKGASPENAIWAIRQTVFAQQKRRALTNISFVKALEIFPAEYTSEVADIDYGGFYTALADMTKSQRGGARSMVHWPDIIYSDQVNAIAHCMRILINRSPNTMCTVCGSACIDMFMCSKCATPYCTTQCQVVDWPTHQHICVRSRNKLQT